MSSSTLQGYLKLSEAEDLYRRGNNDLASAKLIEHLRENCDEPRGLAMLGLLASEGGALVQAEQFLRRAIALGAASYEVKRNLATAILNQDRLDEALEAFTYLDTHFDDIHLGATRANVLDRLGRTAEALDLYKRVVQDSRAEAVHWIMYGHALRFAGRTEEAIAAYRRVVDQDPERGEAWWGLADIKSKILTDADVAKMENALGKAVDALNIVPLNMALGRGWDDRGEYERAFGHFSDGNRLRAELLNYDPEALSAEVDQFIRMISVDPPRPPEPSSGWTPVFLVNLPRSGSTLLEQILNRHPQVEAMGELPYIRAMMRGSLEMHMRRSPITVPDYLTRLSPQERQALGAEYLRRASLHRHTDAPFFIDKMPSNWSDVLFIRAILPQARFIEIRRNAMDCCFSNYTHHFGSAHAAAVDLVNQGRACVDYTRLMDLLKNVAPQFMCSIRYETLIDEPEAQLQKVLDYLGLDWSEDLLSFHESDRAVRTPSAEQVRRPLNRSGIGRWKPYAEWLGPLREALGPLADA